MNKLTMSRSSPENVLQSGRVITIDPSDTIPLTCTREVSDPNVVRLESSFLRIENEPAASIGPSSAGPKPIVVRIPQDRLHYVVDYFVSKKGDSVENAETISRSKVWFGVVDGAHRRKASIVLSEKNPNRFKGYSWEVLCIDWQPLDILREVSLHDRRFT